MSFVPGVSMEGPPFQGSVYEFLPEDQTNPGSVGCVTAWGFWQHYMGTVLDQGIADLTNIPAD